MYCNSLFVELFIVVSFRTYFHERVKDHFSLYNMKAFQKQLTLHAKKRRRIKIVYLKDVNLENYDWITQSYVI